MLNRDDTMTSGPRMGTTGSRHASASGARNEAFALMSEALAILDAASTELVVAARLQAAIDSLGDVNFSDAKERLPLSAAVASQIVDRLASAKRGHLHEAIDALAVPAYVTDPDGQVTYWNQHCVAFAGREPELGSDRWCVTWKLYTMLGDQLPHDQCPMAVAIREQRLVRGEVAIAERPDGARVAFTPYPTPLFDDDGQLTGAVNILIDVSRAQREELQGQAEYCRRLAKSTADQQTRIVLTDMAKSCEASAMALATG